MTKKGKIEQEKRGLKGWSIREQETVEQNRTKEDNWMKSELKRIRKNRLKLYKTM